MNILYTTFMIIFRLYFKAWKLQCPFIRITAWKTTATTLLNFFPFVFHSKSYRFRTWEWVNIFEWPIPLSKWSLWQSETSPILCLLRIFCIYWHDEWPITWWLCYLQNYKLAEILSHQTAALGLNNWSDIEKL